MTPTPSGPGPADWLSGLIRAFHPRRWLLCLVGLALTGLSAVLAQSLLDPGPPRWAGWWQQPIEHAEALRTGILDRSLGGIIVRASPLLALNAALWCLIGGWVSRHELMARLGAEPATADERPGPSATALLARRWKALLLCCPIVLFLGLLLLLPVLMAGWANEWLGGPGALVVSLLLPMVLLADLALLVIAIGALAWPLMPVAVAAECGDVFDAMSRAYSYAFQRPLRFLLLTAVALGLAGLPVGVVLYPLGETMAAWEPETRRTVILLAAALSASIFWSLQTLVYLHLRAALDGVDAGEVAVEPLPTEPTGTPSPEGDRADPPAPHDTGPPGATGLVARPILLIGLMVGSWCLTFGLFKQAGGGSTAWLGWGLGETFVPPAEGVYKLASLIAGLWGMVWLALPLWSAVRRLLPGARPRPGDGPPG
jgi:hypothetical protein